MGTTSRFVVDRSVLVKGTLIAFSALVLGIPHGEVTPARAAKEAEEFKVVDIFVEINATDGDSGLQVFLDGDDWRNVTIADPNRKKIFRVKAARSVKRTGLTELAFESAEPGFDELPLEEFNERFPEGDYTVRGKTIDGARIEGTDTLTHTYPDAPMILTPADGSMVAPDNVTISWNPVPDPTGSSITAYEVEVLDNDETRRPPGLLEAILPTTETSFEVPSGFLEPGKQYTVEVLAYEESGNRTLSRIEFSTMP